MAQEQPPLLYPPKNQRGHQRQRVSSPLHVTPTKGWLWGRYLRLPKARQTLFSTCLKHGLQMPPGPSLSLEESWKAPISSHHGETNNSIIFTEENLKLSSSPSSSWVRKGGGGLWDSTQNPRWKCQAWRSHTAEGPVALVLSRVASFHCHLCRRLLWNPAESRCPTGRCCDPPTTSGTTGLLRVSSSRLLESLALKPRPQQQTDPTLACASGPDSPLPPVSTLNYFFKQSESWIKIYIADGNENKWRWQINL